MRVFVAAATGGIGKRLAAGEAGPVLTTEIRGATNAKAKHELDWRRPAPDATFNSAAHASKPRASSAMSWPDASFRLPSKATCRGWRRCSPMTWS